MDPDDSNLEGAPGVVRWRAELFVEAAGDLTECPRWDDRTDRLLWVDIYAGTLNSCDVSGGDRTSMSVGQPLGSYAPRAGQGYVMALETGLALSGNDVSDWSPVGTQRSLPSVVRSNEGSCDPYGRFFAGTMAHDEAPHGGELLRLDAPSHDRPAPVPEQMIVGTTVSNGIGWSADGSSAYYIDSAERRVDLFDYDGATGAMTDRRPFVSFQPSDGYPDGLTVDADDHVWVAFWGGGVVRRFAPDGRLMGIVELPVPRVSSCTFGGADLGELFITTARYQLTAEAFAEYPLSGSIFRCRPGPVGLPVRRYAG